MQCYKVKKGAYVSLYGVPTALERVLTIEMCCRFTLFFWLQGPAFFVSHLVASRGRSIQQRSGNGFLFPILSSDSLSTCELE